MADVESRGVEVVGLGGSDGSFDVLVNSNHVPEIVLGHLGFEGLDVGELSLSPSDDGLEGSAGVGAAREGTSNLADELDDSEST